MKAFIAIALLLFAVPCMAQSITFQWDLSLDDAILGTGGGYHLYQSKQSMSYAGPPVATVAPGVNTATIPKPGLGRFYWVATAFAADGTESDYSNEVSATVKPKPPRLISAIQTAVLAPIKALAGLFSKQNKGLRIIPN